MEGHILDISPFLVWIIALSQLLTFGLTIWGLVGSGSKANASLIKEHAKRLDDHNLRIGSVEQSLRSGPTPHDMHVLELALERVNGKMGALSAVLEGHVGIMERLEAMVSRHDTFLLKV